MKLAQSLTLLTSASFNILSVLANFYIIQGEKSLLACPQDRLCDCAFNGTDAGQIYGNDSNHGLGGSILFMPPGFCGSTDSLGFLKEGDSWEIYANEHLQGTCVSDSTLRLCPIYSHSVKALFRCDSQICS